MRDLQLQLYNTQQECKENKRKLEEVSARESPSLMQISEAHTWKICGFEEKMKQAKTGEKTQIKSPPFYDHGYKFGLILGLQGTLFGPTLVSVYCFLMKGEYDAVLSWPILNKKVTITLIDQQEDPRQRENKVTFFDSHKEPFANCFTRLESDGHRTIKGRPLLKHDDLNKRRYVVDDTIFIEIQID